MICTPAAFAGLSSIERAKVIAVLQSATADGGVHLVETIVAGQEAISEDELRARYIGMGCVVRSGTRRRADLRRAEGGDVAN